MIINTLTNSGHSLGKFMLSAIIVGVASVFIILGYGLIAVQLLIKLVESYLVIGGGALMPDFSGSRWTHNLSNFPQLKTKKFAKPLPLLRISC